MINLHIVRNSVTHDGRVLKATKSLSDSGLFGHVEICGFAEPNDVHQEVLGKRFVWRVALRTRELPKDLLSQAIKYIEWHWRVVKTYRDKPIRVIHCHDLEPLPIALHLKKLTGAKLIYDAHELESECNGLRGLRKALAALTERALLRFVDAMITVSPSIRSWYAKHFPQVPVSLVRNIPMLLESPCMPQTLREQLNIHDKALLFLYLGGLTRARGIEIALKAFQDSRVPHHLAFMGSGPLHEKIMVAMRDCHRIHLLDPVLPEEVVLYSSGADVGICLIEDTCLSEKFCLANKLFESLLAGVPVLASDLPDQAEIVRTHDAGWIIQNNSDSLVQFLLEITVEKVKENRSGLRERTKDLSWESEAKVLLDLYDKVLTKNANSPSKK